MILLAISGAHGVGKTSLINAFTEAYSDETITIISESARNIIETINHKNYINNDFSIEKQLSIIINHLCNESYVFNTFQGEIIISDRTAIDLWAYTSIFFETFVESPIGRMIEEKIANNIKILYSSIVILPIEFELENDGERYQSKEFQVQVQDKILEIYSKYEIEVFFIRGTINERISILSNYVNTLKKDHNFD